MHGRTSSQLSEGVLLQEMCNDVYCIIEAMVGRSSELRLAPPCLDGVPPCVIGDPDRLRGILLNLYTNAGAA